MTSKTSTRVWARAVPLAICVLTIGSVACSPGASKTDKDASPRTVEAVSAAVSADPHSADAVMEAVVAAGLATPNLRDKTAESCDGEETSCVRVVATDVLWVYEWKTAEDAASFAASMDIYGWFPVALGETTVVVFPEPDQYPPYDRAAYEAVLVGLGGRPTTTTIVEAPAEPPAPEVTEPPVTEPPVTEPPVTEPPAPPTTRPAPVIAVTYANCSEVRAAGAAPILRGQPGYGDHLDRDGDGIACEK